MSSGIGPSRIQIGARLPDLIGETQVGVVRIHDYMDGAWGLIVTFPEINHPVWVTELGMLQKLKREFDARNCHVLGLSISSLTNQEDFLRDVNETQDVKLGFPVVADENGELSRSLGLVPDGVPKYSADSYRLPYSSTIILDMDLNVQFLSYTPMTTGRNFYEVLRLLDAYRTALFNQVVTPSNWKINEEVFIEPDIRKEEVKRLFPNGVHEIKPYLRITASPGLTEND